MNLSRNQTLPQLDGFVAAAKDVGTETPPIDKTPFQLEAGIVGSVPLQRSAARGNIRAAQASIVQLNARLRWYEDKIAADVQDSVSAILAAHEQLRPRREAVQLTFRMEVAERRKYDLGDSNLFVLNLRELDTRDAASLEIDAIVTYFVATAYYHAALGLDGLRIVELQTNRN
jgi:outer membrane protein TolC